MILFYVVCLFYDSPEKKIRSIDQQRGIKISKISHNVFYILLNIWNFISVGAIEFIMKFVIQTRESEHSSRVTQKNITAKSI